MVSKFNAFILTLFLLLVFYSWLSLDPRVAHDFPYVYPELYGELWDLPLTWTDRTAEGLGEAALFTLWSWPVNLIPALLTLLGVGFPVVERLILLLFLLVGGMGIWRLTSFYEVEKGGRIVGTFLYLANSYILLLIDGGQLSLALAYGFLPFCFLHAEKALRDPQSANLLVSGLTISILGFLDLRYLIILGILLVLRSIYSLRWGRKTWNSYFSVGLVALIVFLGLNSFWLIPLIVNPLKSEIFSALTQTSFVSLVDLGQALTLLSPHWYKNIYGVTTPLRVEFFIYPLLTFLALVLIRGSKIIGFWLLVTVVSIFLIKGFSSPFPEINQWIYLHIPGFSLFRDTTKFFALLALAYAILASFTFQGLVERFKFLSFHPRLLTIFMLGLLLLPLRPIVLNQLTGMFVSPYFQEDYRWLNQVLMDDRSFSRVLWVPSHPPLGYFDPTHPILEATRLTSRRPFTVGVKGEYETLNYLRESSAAGELLDIAGVGYIAYSPLDPRRDELKEDQVKYHQLFLNQILSQNYIEARVSALSLPLIKLRRHQERAFIADNLWLVVGSDDLYQRVASKGELRLSDNPLIFLEELPGLADQAIDLPGSKIVLNNKTFTDLAASFIPSADLIFPATSLIRDPDGSGWWKRGSLETINWRNFLQVKYQIDNQDFSLGGGWAVSEGANRLDLNIKEQPGAVLLARVLESSRSGVVKFKQGDRLIGEVQTQMEDTNIRWFEVGRVGQGSTLALETIGQINVVNALALVDPTQWGQYQERADSLQSRVVDFIPTSGDLQPTVATTRMNSSKYQVKVSGLGASPKMLVFSESFDPRWRLNGQPSVPVYSLLNGFLVDKDGEYTLEYESQQLVIPALLVSVGSLVVVLLLIFKPRLFSGRRSE